MVDSGFADRLASAMRDRRATQTSLAAALEVSPSTVSRWLAGSVPRKLVMVAIAEYLNVDLDWLRDGKGESRFFSVLDNPQLGGYATEELNSLEGVRESGLFQKIKEDGQRSFGTRIHLLRRKLGLSLREFAKLCSMTAGYFSRVESGTRATPSIDTQDKIMAAFPITRQWMLFGMPPLLASDERLKSADPATVSALTEMAKEEEARRVDYFKREVLRLASDKNLSDELLSRFIQSAKEKAAVDPSFRRPYDFFVEIMLARVSAKPQKKVEDGR
ncbi:MAG TPA: helix-turn-helix domain-containing protein [Verrucomicrobiae bacterium]|jgi:transcriptional regulator with XRE-family HTH domain|nr:helix-turn-helix domain-containing protein [Verrucomicrobiae bacterium]